MPLSKYKTSAGIIGGGIIGLCSAYYLQKEGYDVTVIDQSNLSDGCSYGNAGMIVPSHIIPLAAPGMIAKGIRWMFDAKSPFYIHPKISSDLIRWGYFFYRSATTEKVERAVPVLRDISRLSKTLYINLANELGFGLSQKGLLMLYQTIAAEKEETETAHIANKAGVEAHILSASEIQNMENEIKVNVRGGIYFPGDAHLQPGKLMKALIACLRAKGVKFISHTKVEDFIIKNNTVKSIISQNEHYAFDELIIASGSWASFLTKKLGLNLPLQAGKGYSFHLKNVIKNIQIPSLLIEGKVSATPMGNDLRFGGTMEIAGNNHTVNMKRITGIVNTINQFYPEIKLEVPARENIWSGLRPCSPDGLPFIGRLKKIPHVTIASGHGMMGLSLGPATGKLVSELISGKPTSIGIRAFDPERFEK